MRNCLVGFFFGLKVLGIVDESDRKGGRLDYAQITREMKATIYNKGLQTNSAEKFFREGQLGNVGGKVVHKNKTGGATLGDVGKSLGSSEFGKDTIVGLAGGDFMAKKIQKAPTMNLNGGGKPGNGFMSSNSMLGQKRQTNSISLFNNSMNEDIMNEYGDQLIFNGNKFDEPSNNNTHGNGGNGNAGEKRDGKPMATNNDIMNNIFFNKRFNQDDKKDSKATGRDELFMFRKKK
jgi:hypothetical protein